MTIQNDGKGDGLYLLPNQWKYKGLNLKPRIMNGQCECPIVVRNVSTVHVLCHGFNWSCSLHPTYMCVYICMAEPL